MLVSKVWGQEDWVENNEKYCLKVHTMQPGFQSSLHYHKVKDETFLIIHGECDLELPEGIRRMVKGDSQRIMPGILHRFKAINAVCTAIEVSTYHDEADVFRLEESRKIE